MRNDARPIGERLREIEERNREIRNRPPQERGISTNPAERARDTSQQRRQPQPFVTNPDVGDDEQSSR